MLPPDTAMIVFLYAGVGAIVGVLAGLLGVGGGIVIVPTLTFLLPWQGFGGDHLMQVALGTSMASIVFTSISSFRAHHRRGAVRWDAVRAIAPGILAGTFGGTFLVALLPTAFLKFFFVSFLFYVAVQMVLDFKPKASRGLPGWAGMTGVGAGIGLLSSLVGIGGGTLSVPFLAWCNVPLHEAVGTSAAIGFPIALAGAAGYVANGWSVADVPHPALGFVYLPALVGLVVCSMLTAPVGAALAHRLPVRTLKKVFAGFIALTAVKMLWGAMGS